LRQCQPPLLVRISKHINECKIDVVCHHSIFDATAIQSCLSEVEAEVRGRMVQQGASDPRHFIWRANDAQSPTHVEFWTRELQAYQPAKLYSRPSANSLPVKQHHTICIQLSTLEGACKSLYCTLSTFLQAALTKTLSHLTGQSDICFGYVVDNRDTSDTENLMFPTFNTIPIRANLKLLRSNRELIIQASSPNIRTTDSVIIESL
jgi:Condensation domain